MIPASRRAIFDRRRALPTKRARALKARPPMRPIFKAAAANNGPMLFFFPRPVQDEIKISSLSLSAELTKQWTKRNDATCIIVLSTRKAIKFGDKRMNERMNELKEKALFMQSMTQLYAREYSEN